LKNGGRNLTIARRIIMSALSKLLPASALALLLASGAASAVPHPQPGQAGSIDFNTVVRGLDDCISGGATANDTKFRALPAGHVSTPE
jgi:hypothetical protein